LGAFDPVASARDYLIDLSQRGVLFWDVMRQRGNGYMEHEAKAVPHVLRSIRVVWTCAERPSTMGWCASTSRGRQIDQAAPSLLHPRAVTARIAGFKGQIGVVPKAAHPRWWVSPTMRGRQSDALPSLLPEDAIAAPEPRASHA
jgi:hypothetical protein